MNPTHDTAPTQQPQDVSMMAGEPAVGYASVVSHKQTLYIMPGGHQLSDDELAKELEGLPSFDEVEHPDLSMLTEDDYKYAIRKMQRRPIKGIRKWL